MSNFISRQAIAFENFFSMSGMCNACCSFGSWLGNKKHEVLDFHAIPVTQVKPILRFYQFEEEIFSHMVYLIDRWPQIFPLFIV